MMNYKKITLDNGSEFIIRDNENGTETHIPIAEENSDYQRYLRWLNGEDEDGTLS